ncbi:unnamed protein product [Clonostachys rhizophaga]|uniref:Cytochrome P450 n=1 Tax=Clonostachys rhizophaga TaxID=160324 RepID=A0A9N9YGA5_9HYPO|nr:unnamed protein product [Clonostachys rhizophaga]
MLLSPAVLVSAISVSAIILIYKFLIYPAFISPLSKIPAPHWSCHIAPFWLWWAKYHHHENFLVQQNHLARGEALRLAPGLLSLNGYERALKPVYLGGFPKTDFYTRGFIIYNTPNIFTFEDNSAHSSRKRMVSNTFSKSFVLSSATAHSSLQDVLFGRLLPKILHAAQTGQPLEMLELSYSYSMDSFVQWQFGKRIGSNLLENVDERRLYLDGFFAGAPYVLWQYEPPLVNRFLKSIGLIPAKVDAGFRDIEDWNLQKCDSAYQLLKSGEKLNDAETPVVFARAAEVMGNMKPDDKQDSYHNRLEIASDMFIHNSAAHETSGNTLAYIYYELSRHPDVQVKLRQELLTLHPQLKFPQPPGEQLQLPPAKEVDNLSYLEAVIMETLRLYPSVPGGQPRKVPRPCSLGGYDNIPAGTTVQCYAYALHRTPEIFPEPEIWNPDRWVNSSQEHLNQMRRYFWAFGSGGRMCIGNNFAWFSMKHAVGSVYTNFISSIHDHGDMTLVDSYLAGPKGHRVEIKFKQVQDM